MITSPDAVNCSNTELTPESQADRLNVGSKIQNDPELLVRQSFTRLSVQYVLNNDLALVYPLTQAVQNAVTLAYGEYDDSYRFQLAISLDESLTNAIVHGNLEVSSDARTGSFFEELMATRPLQKPYYDRRVYFDMTLDQQQIIIVVRDEGPGFDVASVPDPTAPENLDKPCGRGLALMRSFMDAVVYNASGNVVTMIKRAPCQAND